jgi:hypothetical protein
VRPVVGQPAARGQQRPGPGGQVPGLSHPRGDAGCRGQRVGMDRDAGHGVTATSSGAAPTPPSPRLRAHHLPQRRPGRPALARPRLPGRARPVTGHDAPPMVIAGCSRRKLTLSAPSSWGTARHPAKAASQSPYSSHRPLLRSRGGRSTCLCACPRIGPVQRRHDDRLRSQVPPE